MLSFFLGACVLGAPTAVAPVQDDYPEIDAIFARMDQSGSPGCAVAVIEAGAVAFAKGYGEAHLEHSIPITPRTPFHVASVSKQFTVFAVLLLEAEGQLSLDDDVRDHLPEMHDFGAPITLRHLVHHTSGLRDQWDLLVLAGWRMDDVITHDDVLRLVFAQRELNFAPGERHLYCNTGYTLLAEVVHRVSGRSLREFCEEEIFEVLGMEDTQFYDDHTRLIPGRAESYDQGGSGWRRAVLSYSVAGATSLFTTVRDLARWTENLELRDLGGDEVVEGLLRKGVLNSGREIDYAGGLVHGDLRGLPTVSHGGADAGYRSQLIWFPEHELSVAVLGNMASLDARDLAEKVAELYLGDEMEEPERGPAISGMAGLARRGANPDTESPYVGPYTDPFHDELYTFVQRDDVINVEFGGRSYPLIPDGEGVFDIERSSSLQRVHFLRDDSGEVVGARGEFADAEPMQLEKMEPSFSFRPPELAGRYHCPELDVHYTLISGPGRLSLRRRHHPEAKLEVRYHDGFLVDQEDKIHFLRDENGDPSGFLYTTDRVRNLRFRRVDESTD